MNPSRPVYMWCRFAVTLYQIANLWEIPGQIVQVLQMERLKIRSVSISKKSVLAS